MSVFQDVITTMSSWAISKKERPVFHMYIVPRIGVVNIQKAAIDLIINFPFNR